MRSRRSRLGWLLAACWLAGGPSLAWTAEAPEPKDYADACLRGKAAWDRLQDSDVKPEQVQAFRREALNYFSFALAHPSREAKIDDLNTLRSYVAYLDWATGRPYDAVVLGEFVARRYPAHGEAQQGALVALTAYAQLYQEAKTAAARARIDDRMAALAEFLADRWPNTPGTDQAWMLLIRAAIDQRQWDRLPSLVERIADGSPRRGEADLLAGQALWSSYLSDRSNRSEKAAKLAERLPQAKKLLEGGLDRLRKAAESDPQKVSYASAAAALSLAQICLEQNRPQEAVRWLDDKTIGPHTLVEANHPVVGRGNFRLEALKAALRAYVASQQPDKAQAAMQSLEKLGGVDLTRVYLELGRQIEEAQKSLREKNDPAAAAKLSQGFAAMLARIAERPVAELGWNHALWTAGALMQSAIDADQDDGPPSREAADRYRKAAAMYAAVLKAFADDPKRVAQPAVISGVQLRLARCLRRLGQYAKAIDLLVAVLKSQGNLLEAQQEAARTYQAWGATQPDRYRSAIRGQFETRRDDGSVDYLIWGWGGIARRTQSNLSRPEIFHEARYHLALCRYQQAMAASGRSRTELLNQARRDIEIVRRLYPEMGGSTWRGRYDALLQKIEKQLGSKSQEAST
ncbi:MAG: hypothetical protein LLF97_02595 [Planctomycetaceae bacterium]|nr:hypothetical protein [Planctomycetaceae bacterium]